MQKQTNSATNSQTSQHKLFSELNQNPQISLKQMTLRIHDLYYKQIKFKEIDYIAGEAPPGLLPSTQNKQFGDFIFLADACLVFTEKLYDRLYYFLLKTVINVNQPWKFRNNAGDILISMNGQNEKVYNLKKTALKHMINSLNQETPTITQQNQQKLDLDRQLSLNAAVRMKFKKSSACYEYRIKLMQYKFKADRLHQDPVNLQKLHKTEHELIVKILERFPRNYFCWMYRLRLFKQFISVTKNSSIFESQLTMVLQMLNKHPNDNSILSYLRFLLRLSISLQSYNLLIQITQKKCDELLQFCKLAYQSEQQYKRLIEFALEVKNADQKQEKIP